MTKCLIYCTKDKNNQLYRYYGNKYDVLSKNQYIMPQPDFFMNGKIVAQFDCEMVEIFTIDYRGDKEQNKRISKDSCVSIEDLIEYQKDNHFLNAIHISNLEIFEKPKELSDFVYLTCGYEQCSKCKYYKAWGNCCPQEFELEKAPQNMMNVWKKRNSFSIELNERRKEQYILISIRPEWVAKILNGEKTIEVRKKIVNRLKEKNKND